ncbi:MAG TPA: ribonuclease P protein component [Candidatus Paceibacterota bacterium]|nr:ribonuclease P protein component [Candidatus Paceibacterota bacterium]
MLPKRRRLTSAEVSEVITQGKPLRGAMLSIKHLPSPGGLKAAVVAPKSLVPRAVDRNRLRRALYAALKTLPGESFKGSKAVFFVRTIPPAPLTSAFREELTLLAKKI